MILRMVWPAWALLLVLGPLLALCVAGWWRARRSEGRGGGWLRRAAMVLATLVIGLAPAVPAETTRVETNAEVFFVVDRTGSMAAEDYDGAQPRLAGVRHDLVALVEALPGARYSVIGFDSQASRQLPLTTDARAVRTWAETLRQEITRFSAGSAVDRPRDALTEALTGAATRNPGNVRLVFVLADGEDTSGADDPSGGTAGFAELAGLIDGGAVLGYGTTAGGRMRSYDGTESTGPGTAAPWILDEASPGSPPAVSRIDETNLRRLAAALGVPYAHRIAPTPVADLVAGIDVEELAADGRRDVRTYRDVLWPAAAVLAVLVAAEAFAQAARWRRLSGVPA
ncbi:vWA domain-containing protein [Georgenia yuyongxinii]|uniref:VWA domain-containing protein n=1 Tax=Georgenia yuyongxinii TaxID=2589797 RepID=A0A552WVU5_9MICO|nr:VWA domain-containing protein [Georgenia yuyongxinii]TRW46960.1 VWA domain-containing protein [Georgenia yuyongxinii]